MPKSKKPRKSGKFGRVNAACKKWTRSKFKSVEDAMQCVRALDEAGYLKSRGEQKMQFMLALRDSEMLTDAFLKAQLALRRWPTTTEYEDFNRVASSLMLGALVHHRLGVAEKELLDEIQFAAYMSVVCVRLRNFEKDIPEANLRIVSRGLDISQELMTLARETDPQALVEVLMYNEKDHVSRAGLKVANEKALLGKYYDTVAEWEARDEETWNTGILGRQLEKFDGRQQKES